jgi:NAD(P)-dependent dehydrogenase (short-subunit alcohol dehydrogenase family)
MMKIAVVTGANRGIGLQLSKDLIAKNYHVVMGTRKVEECKDAMKDFKSSSYTPLFVDVQDNKSVEAFVAEIKAKFKNIDLIINNAAVYLDQFETLYDQDIAIVEKTIQTNLMGYFYVVRHLVELMQQNGGDIINISSGAAYISSMHQGTGAYRISKFAVNGMSMILADELKEFNINVYPVCPGWVKTDMGGSGADLSVEEASEGILKVLSGDKESGKLYHMGELRDW